MSYFKRGPRQQLSKEGQPGDWEDQGWGGAWLPRKSPDPMGLLPSCHSNESSKPGSS